MIKAQAVEQSSRWRTVLLTIGVIFISFNLRPAITSVGPLIDSIRIDLQLTNGMAGFIAALPLLAFATLSPFAPIIGRQLGNKRAIFLSIALLTVGIIVRSTGALATLFIGTALAGVGIAIGNVLLPGFVKESFPTKVALMTGVYTASLGGFAGIASGVSIPLAETAGLGWRGALIAWAILSVVALLLWIPQVTGGKKKEEQMAKRTKATDGNLLRSKLAWQVTFFMGCQSLIFYCMVTWLPEILYSHGLSRAMSGWMVTVVQLIGIPISLMTPIIAGKLQNQRIIVLVISVLYFVGFSGLLFGGGTTWIFVWIIMLGLAQGGGFSLALTLFVLRAHDAEQAARLSGMAQSLGYILAASGPIFVGMLFDFTDEWKLPILLLMFFIILLLIVGLGAGRNKFVTLARAS